VLTGCIDGFRVVVVCRTVVDVTVRILFIGVKPLLNVAATAKPANIKTKIKATEVLYRVLVRVILNQ
jgi:hypothetical protein